MHFDPDFDDTEPTWAWLDIPFVQIQPGSYPNGYSVRRAVFERAPIAERTIQLPYPLDCRGLYDPSGLLWMSDTPQERLMMYNNAQASQGNILIGGLGLGLYPQYVASRARSLTIVERSRAIADIVWPQIAPALAQTLGTRPLRLIIADVERFLARAPEVAYDTIFLDTWEELSATRLPYVNLLRDLAIQHLAPDGRVLLWGYRWMMRLFEDACRDLLRQPPQARSSWLEQRTQGNPAARALLLPVLDRFAGQAFDDLALPLAWCRRWASTVHPNEP